MDTRTGEIKYFKHGEKVPEGFAAIDRPPRHDCFKCGGRGSVLVSKWRRLLGTKAMYRPCDCTKDKQP